MASVHKIPIYDPDGNARYCYPVDAREILVHGFYTAKPPAAPLPKPTSDLDTGEPIQAVPEPIPPLPFDPASVLSTEDKAELIEKEKSDEIARQVRVAVTGTALPDYKLCLSYDRRTLANYAQGWGIVLDQRMKPENMIEDFKAKMKRRAG